VRRGGRRRAALHTVTGIGRPYKGVHPSIEGKELHANSLATVGGMADVDVVVVTYNSRDHARACVAPLAEDQRLNVVVVDNASNDGTPETLADLPLTLVRSSTNGGFAAGCNIGWRKGSAPFVLFLNPDARADPFAVLELARVLDQNPSVGAAGPRLVDEHGSLQHSQRRFPTLTATIAHAFFVHRLLPKTSLNYDVADPRAYETRRSVEWLSGACLLVRRSVLDELDGFDERFFMYCEDMDLCSRVHALGLDVVYVPTVTVSHAGGASAPRATTVRTMMTSRLLYAEKHRGTAGLALERAALTADSLLHALFTSQGAAARRGYASSAWLTLTGRGQAAAGTAPSSRSDTEA